MRKPIIAGNWKMFNTIKEAVDLVNGLKRELCSTDSVDIVVCPAFTSLSDVREILIDSNIKLGAQDMYWEKKGAFTGEVSADMLKDAGCEYVIIGHSERRQYFHETNSDVNKKIKAALEAGLKPIVCVGETLNQREQGKAFDVIKDHVQNALEGIKSDSMKNIVFAYEPVWAIGTGKTATPEIAQQVHAHIRKMLGGMFNDSIAQETRIQYGGSVKPDNIRELMNEQDIDGALVGGASLKADSFSAIVKGAV
ncbi:MAG: triose-phosphate isomerase [Candidatus Omnitrophica bacterium]|jgi:triosephosphate isomerase|nr:triose-phosphate isomerase [Candidatus Omnitrophota bacterium]